MESQELREIILNAISPPYEKKFGWKPSKNVYNISSLTHGAKAFLYQRQRELKREFNRHIVRGSAIDELVKARMETWDNGDGDVLKWTLPYQWKDSSVKDILLIGHFDMKKIFPEEAIVFDTKAPESEQNFRSNGSMVRALRQVGAYATLLSIRYGKPFQAFVVLINGDVSVTKLTPEQVRDGWLFVKRTAYEVARMLDQ